MIDKLLILLQLGGFLLFLMAGNILLGKKIADLKDEYDKATFLNGIFKGGVIAVFIIGIYFFGLLPLFAGLTIVNPLNGAEVSIEQLISYIMYAGITLYLGLDIVKIIKLIGLSTEAKAEEIIDVDIDTPIEEEVTTVKTKAKAGA